MFQMQKIYSWYRHHKSLSNRFKNYSSCKLTFLLCKQQKPFWNRVDILAASSTRSFHVKNFPAREWEMCIWTAWNFTLTQQHLRSPLLLPHRHLSQVLQAQQPVSQFDKHTGTHAESSFYFYRHAGFSKISFTATGHNSSGTFFSKDIFCFDIDIHQSTLISYTNIHGTRYFL